MRMYGLENNAVVMPTNAVSATRNTLNGSTRNCWCSASSGPVRITRTVSEAAATKVQALAATFTAGAIARCPMSASAIAPITGVARTTMISITGARLFLELLEVLQVEAVELLADLEEEHAEDQHADEHVERHAELDDHRHPISGAGRGKEQAVFHRKEA